MMDFIIGLIVGGFIGMFIMAIIAGRRHGELARIIRQQDEEINKTIGLRTQVPDTMPAG